MANVSQSNRTKHVTIVGGGVVGCFLAYCLTTAGMPVTVIERERVGAGATGASAGNVQAVTDICSALEVELGVESLRRWRHYLPAIKAESGMELLDQDVRYFYPALEEKEVSGITALASTLRAQGLNTEWIDSSAALNLEPRLHPGVLGGMLHQDVVQMDAQRCVTALETIIQARGGTFIYSDVTGLRRDGDQVNGVELSDGSTVPCETLVLALGGLTGIALERWLSISLPIQPYSLEKLHVRPLGAPLACAVRCQGVNIVTRRDGNVHVGSKHNDTGVIAQPSESGKQRLLDEFRAVLPGVEIEIGEAAAGLAAYIPDPDRTPIVGRVPNIDGLYVAVPTTNGFLLSGLMSSLLADYLTTGSEDPMLLHMRPDRPI